MSEVIFQNENHKNVLLEDGNHGLAVQANVHLIIHRDKSILLDPGGHKVYNKALSNLTTYTNVNHLKYIFLSHQDPDIVAAVNGWLMSTDANAFCPEQWIRFVPHFGVDRFVADRIKPIGNEGMILDLEGCSLKIIPAHFLHSLGNFQLYDPESKILYSGDLGASLGMDYKVASDFEEHTKYMIDFHKRYMVSNQVLKLWANMIKDLDIEIIAPQHGAMMKGKDMVEKFISWCENLQCGIDLLKDIYKIPN